DRGAPGMSRISITVALAALCACSGATGTLVVGLTTERGSHVLDAVQRLRVTVTNPRNVIEATRTSAGFNILLEFDAAITTGSLIVEGFDGAGTLVACGQSPGFPVNAITAQIAIYMAAPRSIALSPVALELSDVSATPLSYGVVFAGGRDSGGALS